MKMINMAQKVEKQERKFDPNSPACFSVLTTNLRILSTSYLLPELYVLG